MIKFLIAEIVMQKPKNIRFDSAKPTKKSPHLRAEGGNK